MVERKCIWIGSGCVTNTVFGGGGGGDPCEIPCHGKAAYMTVYSSK